ncbi:MAG: peptidoglycan-binding protein [Aquabacterium sp.]|nr:MAG: peptidoglycan-binding protein [Aquabacterium sp.]
MKFATHSSARLALLSALALGITGCQGTAPTIGDSNAKTAATGSAGGANSQGENKQLEKCSETLGTVAVVEDTGSIWYQELQSYNLRSTIPVLRLLIQQSNCFVVIERGAAMRNMNMERQLRDSGEMRANSNMGKGQMVAADYTMNPSITFSQKGTGGMGGILGGFGGGVLGAVAGSLKFNDASTVLTMIDNRSGVQLAAAEGSARNTDFNLFGGLAGGGAFGGLGGYTNTPEGKVLVAAFIDSYNQLVKSVRSYKAQEVKGGLGTGGRLGVQGGSTPASTEGTASPKKSTKKKTTQ